MPEALSRSETHLALPRVLCPRCGTQMRLTQITPDAADRYKIEFACACGFEYRMDGEEPVSPAFGITET